MSRGNSGSSARRWPQRSIALLTSGVVHVHVDRGRGIHPRQFLDGDGSEEDVAPGPAHCSGISTPIKPSSKSLAIRSGRKVPASSISATCRPDLGFRELSNGRAEELLLFGSVGCSRRMVVTISVHGPVGAGAGLLAEEDTALPPGS